MTKKVFTLMFSQSMFILLFFLLSCQKEGELGMNILPKGDEVVFKYDTLALSAYTFKADSTYSSTTSFCLIGSTNDEIFGKTQASFFLQLNNSTTVFKPKNIVDIDSIILQLPFTYSRTYTDTANNSVTVTTIDSSYYGTLNQPFHFRVYEMTQQIQTDTIYYNTMKIDNWYNPAKMYVSETKVFNGNETSLKFSLNQDFIDKIKNADSADFATSENFLNFFKGFYFAVDEQTALGAGAIFSLNASSTDAKVIVYHRSYDTDGNIDTLSTSFSFGSGTPRINVNSHDYRNTDFYYHLNQTGIQDTVAFIQAVNGLTTKIFLNNNEITNLENKIIYDARLIVYLHDTLDVAIKPFELTRMPVLYQISDDLLAKEVLSEYNLSSGYLGSYRNKDVFSYSITKFFQDLTMGKEKNNGFILQDNATQSTARRCIIRTGNNSKPMQIVVKYSDL